MTDILQWILIILLTLAVIDLRAGVRIIDRRTRR